jgi:N-acetylmuramoyl-L-alanine amidase
MATYTVALDPGHGIETAGKRSCDGTLREYEFNRSVPSKIKPILERHGVTVIVTSTTDSDVTLANRCALANNAKANIFVSIHANAAGDGKIWSPAKGWEIFICKGSVEGNKLAEAIESESIPFLGFVNRGIKDDELYVTYHTKMPAVLTEHGFYTNRTEVELLKSDSFRNKCALADAKGILKYLGIEYKEESTDLYKVQVGAFKDESKAKAIAEELKKLGYSANVVKSSATPI